MKRLISLSILLVIGLSMMAQDQKFGISFSGFVKNDFFFDSRQTVAAREGHFLLWPAAEKLDANGADINSQPSFNFLAIQSRLTGKITGPDAFGAKTSGILEGAFFGQSNADVNGFRLRHAYGKLNWENTELLFGQTWNPMFIAGCFPGVVSFNTGAPFQPFARNPQLKITQSLGAVKVSATAYSQRDFTCAGGAELLRNSSTPAFHLGASYGKKGDLEVLTGIGASYQVLVPRLETDDFLIANEHVSGFNTEAYLKVKGSKLTFKCEATYGQNTFDVTGISSFAVIGIDSPGDHRDYAPLNSMSVWSEIHTNGKIIQLGIFGGYSKNLGTDKTILSIPHISRSNIDYLYRISPRIHINSGKMRFAGEVEYTTAAFGNISENGSVEDAIPVSNLRLLVAAYYFF